MKVQQLQIESSLKLQNYEIWNMPYIWEILCDNFDVYCFWLPKQMLAAWRVWEVQKGQRVAILQLKPRW